MAPPRIFWSRYGTFVPCKAGITSTSNGYARHTKTAARKIKRDHLCLAGMERGQYPLSRVRPWATLAFLRFALDRAGRSLRSETLFDGLPLPASASCPFGIAGRRARRVGFVALTSVPGLGGSATLSVTGKCLSRAVMQPSFHVRYPTSWSIQLTSRNR